MTGKSISPDAGYEAASEFLPIGLISPEQWAGTREWVRELPYETMFYEANVVADPDHPEHAKLARDLFNVLILASIIERRTEHYIELPLFSKALEDKPDRVDFLENVWLPDETAHYYVDAAIAEMGLGLGVSEMDQRYTAAINLMPSWMRTVGNKGLEAMGQVAPEAELALVDADGAKNETIAEFNYWAIQSIFRQLGAEALAEALAQPRRDEPKHRKEYLEDLGDILEDHRLIRSVIGARMKLSKRFVGQELRTEAESQLMLRTLFDPNNDKHRKFIEVRDGQFASLLGMGDVRPVQATLTRLGLW